MRGQGRDFRDTAIKRGSKKRMGEQGEGMCQGEQSGTG